jgi:hypothetical protein
MYVTVPMGVFTMEFYQICRAQHKRTLLGLCSDLAKIFDRFEDDGTGSGTGQ